MKKIPTSGQGCWEIQIQVTDIAWTSVEISIMSSNGIARKREGKVAMGKGKARHL
jgi:hypothetical protein